MRACRAVVLAGVLLMAAGCGTALDPKADRMTCRDAVSWCVYRDVPTASRFTCEGVGWCVYR